MSGGIATITNSHSPTPFRTCEGEARLGTGLPNLFQPRPSTPGGLARLQSPYQRPTERAVSIGGDPIATGSLPARWANGAASWAVDKIVELEVV